MAGDAKKLQPIIVKRIKKGGHGAHGGAWKIAYADFVTAMMAFFLLMWLLGSTTEGDRKGLQDYFNSPLKVAMSGGSGSGDSSSVIKGGGEDLTRTAGQVKHGAVEAPKRTFNLQALKAEQARAEAAKLMELQNNLQERIAASEKFKALSSQLKMDMTRDGLRIQIVDAQNRPMFDSGSAVVKPYMRDLLRSIGEVLAGVPNLLTLEGHTDATPFSGNGLGYSNWELSADRANASRRELIAGGLGENRILRVQGLASSQLFNPKDPHDPSNRRISIIVMNREAEDRVFKTAPEPDNAASDSPAEDTKASTPPSIDR
ncbi:flagellar motor protein MotB [Ideonella dechloratans]|uniref:Flagellar motor protein MotB n=1 Tax=Ideonella dechloratans TaxID=36863 RepID=A0A643F858_IDEDE|nr:flagellar motor protein MotB [Ideonella dechloratans]KAB0577392.1 flagellar motor protein MotB [Ideonella dechloratans]UFU09255.1 flagellar motor protein MotB [Ideonella dechloratans]